MTIKASFPPQVNSIGPTDDIIESVRMTIINIPVGYMIVYFRRFILSRKIIIFFAYQSPIKHHFCPSKKITSTRSYINRPIFTIVGPANL